jgi:hypothetical protein
MLEPSKEREAWTMETTYYTLNAREIIVTGDAVAKASGAPERQLVWVRRKAALPERRRDNVISLADWKAAREEETDPEELRPVSEGREPALRTDRVRSALLGGEALATLSVIGAMVLLMVRILT